MGERTGRTKSRNVTKGPMDIANGMGIDCGSGGIGRAGESNGEKTGTTITE